MPNWKDNLRDASFRGVKFYVDSADTGIGRRNVVHQYPFKDTPYVEDLGPDADEFVINAYVIQNKYNGFDYFAQRDLLIKELRKTGSGTLVHPSFGEIRVAVKGKVRVTESYQKEGGIARFTITFVQSGSSIFPEITVDHVSAITAFVDTCIGYVQDSFAGNEIPLSMAGLAIRSSGYVHSGPTEESFLSAAKKGLKQFKNTIQSTKYTISSSLSKILNEIDEDISLLSSVLASPCDLGSTLVDGFNRGLQLIGIPDNITREAKGRCSGLVYGLSHTFPNDSIPQKLGVSLVKGLVAMNKFGEGEGSSSASMYGGNLPTVTITSPLTARENFNQMKLINLIREVALLLAMKVAVRIDYESYDDAVDIMNTVSDAIDDLLTRLGDLSASTDYEDYDLFVDTESEYSNMDQARSQFVKAMLDIGADLAKIEEYTVPNTIISTLSLAYLKYGDINRAEEIQERNKDLITNPCFIPEGQVIKILSV